MAASGLAPDKQVVGPHSSSTHSTRALLSFLKSSLSMCMPTDIHEWMESPERAGFVCTSNATDLRRGQQALGQKLSAACRWVTKLMELTLSLSKTQTNAHLVPARIRHWFLCSGSRYCPRACGCRCDRCHQATVRHMGVDCKPGQPHGQHRCEWTHPSAWGHPEDPGRVGLRFGAARRDLCQGGECPKNNSSSFVSVDWVLYLGREVLRLFCSFVKVSINSWQKNFG